MTTETQGDCITATGKTHPEITSRALRGIMARRLFDSRYQIFWAGIGTDPHTDSSVYIAICADFEAIQAAINAGAYLGKEF